MLSSLRSELKQIVQFATCRRKSFPNLGHILNVRMSGFILRKKTKNLLLLLLLS